MSASSSGLPPGPPAPGAGSAGPPAPGGPPRPRRAVGALLNSYYSIDKSSAEKKDSPAVVSDDHIDRQGFDARRYFESVITAGQLPDLVKRSETLDAEVKSMNSEMQGLVYDNFSKFIRATDLIKDMRTCVDGLQPDIKQLEGNIQRLEEYETRVEQGISDRARQLSVLLKRQRYCRKLEVLFGLPNTLQQCIDTGEFRKAIQAYSSCVGFLKQYNHMPAFKKVMDEANEKMIKTRDALELRLQSPDLSVDEAVDAAFMLLDLGSEQQNMATDYLRGRDAMLRRTLDYCFAKDAGDDLLEEDDELKAQEKTESMHPQNGITSATDANDQKDSIVEVRQIQIQESAAVRGTSARVTSRYIPQLCEAVEGARRLVQGGSSSSTAPSATGFDSEGMVADFVGGRASELCERISKQVEELSPSTRVIVTCVRSVGDSLKKLPSPLPRLLNRPFLDFLSSTANSSMKALFSDAVGLLVSDIRQLHCECRRLHNTNSGCDDVLEEISKTEQRMMMRAFTALTDSEPLLGLLNSDRSACQQLVRNLNIQLIAFFLSFVEACYIYTSHDDQDRDRCLNVGTLPTLPESMRAEIQGLSELPWNELFALALVRIGRHLEVKAITKIWGVAKDLFGKGDVRGSELVTSQAVIQETRDAAQAVITHYVLVNGQHLAHLFRTNPASKSFMTMREPREPRQAVEMALRKAYACDTQLAHILGDPRKPRSDTKRSGFSQRKSDMELELERQLARKLQVYAPIPFNRNGAVLGILRIAFKALYEYSREETFAKFGLQQIQLDCAFLAEVIRDLVAAEDASTLDSLLDEAVTSASARCCEPVLMDAMIVEALCDEKKKAFVRGDGAST